VAARGSAESDRIVLGRNLQPQLYAVLAIYTLGSLHRVPQATQTFAEGSTAAKKVEIHYIILIDDHQQIFLHTL